MKNKHWKIKAKLNDSQAPRVLQVTTSNIFHTARVVFKPKSVVRLSSKMGKIHAESDAALSAHAPSEQCCFAPSRRRCWEDRQLCWLLLCCVASGSFTTAVREEVSQFRYCLVGLEEALCLLPYPTKFALIFSHIHPVCLTFINLQ